MRRFDSGQGYLDCSHWSQVRFLAGKPSLPVVRLVESSVSDENEAHRDAATKMIEAADTIITAAVEASEMIFEKHGEKFAPEDAERVATIAKFVFMATSETSDDSDFQGVVAARAIDRLISLKMRRAAAQ